MIEKIVIQHLSSLMDVHVYAERPENPEPAYILIEKTGSRRRNLIDRAVIAVQSYGPTLLDAAEMNEQVKAAMDDLIINDHISKCKLATDHNFTDTETKSYRYQAVYEITHD